MGECQQDANKNANMLKAHREVNIVAGWEVLRNQQREADRDELLEIRVEVGVV